MNSGTLILDASDDGLYVDEGDVTINGGDLQVVSVNDAVYIAKYQGGDWTATGTQFAVPYVFKKLFSHEPIEFEDMCETKSVSTALYLSTDDPNEPRFIGRVGAFCPIKPGCGGRELLREGKDKEGNLKFSAATGSKGYEWLEAEMVQTLGKENDIDRSYYDRLVDDAVETISKYGDFEWFISEDPYEGSELQFERTIPF